MTNDPMNQYSNFRATMAIAVASFRSIIRSPSAVVFSLAFPLIFIVVFANIGGGAVTVEVGVARTCDTSGPVYQVLQKVKMVHLIRNQSTGEMTSNLSKGNIDAIINIQKNDARPPYTLHVQYSEASSQKGAILRSLLNDVFTG